MFCREISERGVGVAVAEHLSRLDYGPTSLLPHPPQPHGAVIRSGGEELAVGAEGHAVLRCVGR